MVCRTCDDFTQAVSDKSYEKLSMLFSWEMFCVLFVNDCDINKRGVRFPRSYRHVVLETTDAVFT